MYNATSNPSVGTDCKSQEQRNHISSSPASDVDRTSSRANDCISTPHFERIWWDKGSDLRRPVSIWRPLPRSGFSILGDCIIEGLEPPSLGLLFKCDGSGISAKPLQFTNVAHIVGKGHEEAFFWYPIAPPGYAPLGCIVSGTAEPPSLDSFCCPRIDLVSQANISELPISRSSTSRGSPCWSIWKVENQAAGTFLARSDLKKPSNRLVHSIGDYVKPKARENVSAEMKLECFSLSILDSLSGMMTPLFNTTITNINLATHGQLESMNAVLISSVAASTFNPQLEAWEPLLEPFNGIFKFETYDSDEPLRTRVGKCIRVAATSTVNLNISAANLETFAESIVYWRMQEEIDQKSVKANEEPSNHLKNSNDTALSALEEDDFQKVIVENKLGCDIYLKKFEQDLETIELLQHEGHVSAWIPPPLFSDRLNVGTGSRESRFYVAVQIFESRGLPILDDGHDFFCALRLAIDGPPSYQQKLLPQSARTRCVKPLVSKANGLSEGTVKWNEYFIFEIPRKFFWYRSEPLSITAISAQIAVVPFGRVMAATLSERRFFKGSRWEFTLNPGPFNIKEHVLITIFANAGGGTVYAIHIVTAIKAYYKKRTTFISAFLVSLTAQVLGFGWAGLFRRFLVEPAEMWWPMNLVQVSLFRNLNQWKQRQGKLFSVCWFCLDFGPVLVLCFLPKVSILKCKL